MSKIIAFCVLVCMKIFIVSSVYDVSFTLLFYSACRLTFNQMFELCVAYFVQPFLRALEYQKVALSNRQFLCVGNVHYTDVSCSRTGCFLLTPLYMHGHFMVVIHTG